MLRASVHQPLDHLHGSPSDSENPPSDHNSGPTLFRGPGDHVNLRILHSGSKVQYKEESKKKGDKAL